MNPLVTTLAPDQIAGELRDTVDDAAGAFTAHSDAQAMERPAPGTWCAKEVIGHLIDSAANNHRRFILGQDDGDLVFDGYQQDDWVRRQGYHHEDWNNLIGLWRAYNHHLARVIAAIPPTMFPRTYTMRGTASSETLTFGYLVEDYVRHLQHHVAQIHTLLQRPSRR